MRKNYLSTITLAIFAFSNVNNCFALDSSCPFVEGDPCYANCLLNPAITNVNTVPELDGGYPSTNTDQSVPYIGGAYYKGESQCGAAEMIVTNGTGSDVTCTVTNTGATNVYLRFQNDATLSGNAVYASSATAYSGVLHNTKTFSLYVWYYSPASYANNSAKITLNCA